MFGNMINLHIKLFIVLWILNLCIHGLHYEYLDSLNYLDQIFNERVHAAGLEHHKRKLQNHRRHHSHPVRNYQETLFNTTLKNAWHTLKVVDGFHNEDLAV